MQSRARGRKRGIRSVPSGERCDRKRHGNLHQRPYRIAGSSSEGRLRPSVDRGRNRPDETVATYVVTPQLVRSFDDALGLIRSAVEGRTSKAAYLHGSFGSGKSHFMAILYLLLHHNAAVRSVSELAPVIEKHNAWIQGKKFLLITYYMIGAKDMESKILGEYVRQIEHLHPGTSIPGVYRSEALFKDAEALRADMGDEQFFAKLNKGAAGTGASGWGEIAAGWGPRALRLRLPHPRNPKSGSGWWVIWSRSSTPMPRVGILSSLTLIPACRSSANTLSRSAMTA